MAAASQQAPSAKDKALKYTSLAVLVLQNTCLVLFMKFAMSGNRPKFLKTISVFWAEVLKMLASIALVCVGKGSLRLGFGEIWTELTQNKADSLKVLVPAIVYTIQNFLLYVAVENLPSTTFMVTYQLKILTTALFTVAVLKRRLSIAQWIALFFLFAGVAVVQYDQKMSENREKMERQAALEASMTSTLSSFFFNESVTEDDVNGTLATTEVPATIAILTTSSPKVSVSAPEQNSVLGFSAVLVACVLSGFAGIYLEKILKKSKVSLWTRNFQLAAPSIVFALLFAFVKDRGVIFSSGLDPSSMISNMMSGFDWAVWVTVSINALGGLVVAVVIKYADNILKAFATSVAIVMNCVLSYFLFTFRPTFFFILGAGLVMGAVFVYSLFPYRASHQPVPTKEEEAAQQELEDLADCEKGKKGDDNCEEGETERLKK